MKGRRNKTEENIRILRESDQGKAMIDVCREHDISEGTFHRWKRQFGQMEVNEAKRFKELERENGDLKKMLAESLQRRVPVVIEIITLGERAWTLGTGG